MAEASRLFISYARHDASAFAEELLNGLEVAGFEPFLDRHDIAAGEDWELRLGGLIQSADTVVFVVSPAAVASERCAWELKKAEALSKRIIPVVLIDVPEAQTPASLKRLNYIFFTEGHSFTRALKELATALRIDLDWIREHTRLAELARRWHDRDQSNALLLRGAELNAARAWLASWKSGAPEPTDLHRAFINESEKEEGALLKLERERVRRLRVTARILQVLAALATISAGVGWYQWQQARSALRDAVASKLVLKSRAILEGQSDLPIDIGLLLAATAFELKKTNETKSNLQFALNMTTALQKVISFPESVAAVSADGTTAVTFTQRLDLVSALSMNSEAVLRLRDSSTGQVRGDLITDFKVFVPSVAFSPDGKTFVTGQTEDLNHESVRLWDAVTGRPLGEPLGLDITVQGHLDGIVLSTPEIAFSPDGRTIVSSSVDGSLRVWDMINGRMIVAPLKGHQHLVTSVSFSADGKTIISGGRDGTLHLWDIASGQPLRTPIQAHTGEVQSVALSRDRKVIASLGTDNTLRLWDVSSGLTHTPPLQGDMNNTTSVAFSPDGKAIVTGREDGSLHRWDVAQGQELQPSLLGEGSPVTKITYVGDDRLTFVRGGKTLVFWEPNAHPMKGTSVPGHTGKVTSLAVKPDGKTFVSAADDGSVRSWDVLTGQARSEPVLGVKSDLISIAFSSDGKSLTAFNGNSTLRRWDSSGPELQKEFRITANGVVGREVQHIAFSPDGKTIALGYADGRLSLLDVATGRLRGDPWDAHGGLVVAAVAFGADSKTVVSAAAGNLRLWDTTTFKQKGGILRVDKNVFVALSIAISPDGRSVAAGTGDSLLLWNAVTGQLTRTLGVPSGARSVAFSPDGATIVAGAGDGSVRMWDSATGQALGTPLLGHRNDVTAIIFTPDGKKIISGDRDGALRLWDAPAAWIDRVCEKVVRNLSRSEWMQYVGSLPYLEQCPRLPVPVSQ